MSLKVLIEDQEQVPEGFTDYYEQQDDGTYVLKLEGVDSHPDVANLRNAYRQEQNKRKKIAKERDEFKKKAELLPDDVEPDLLQQAIESLQNGDSNNGNQDQGNQNADPTKLREQIEKQWKVRLEEKDNELSKRDMQIRELVVDSGLASALSKYRITNPVYQKAAKRLLSDQIQVVEDEEDGSIKPIVDTDMGKISLDQYVRDWAAGDEGQAFIDGNVGGKSRNTDGASGPKGKRLKREQFDGLPPEKKMEFTKNGGQIIE